MTLDVARLDVKTLIPHREPFLLVDALTEYSPGLALRAVKAVSRAEPWFQGHFPDFAVLPGVLVAEALAQTCAIFMRLENDAAANSDDDIYVLLRTEMRNSRPALPGSLLMLSVEKSDCKGDFVEFKVNASQGGRTCARGKLTVGKTQKHKLIHGSGE